MINRNDIKALLIFPVIILMLTSCYKMRIEVHDLPSNTPSGENIFITGNFNNWDPGDSKYVMTRQNDTLWYIDMPRGIGAIEYKFTRGDWSTVEKDVCGEEIDNRMATFSEDKPVEIVTIESWRDLDPVNCQWMTLVITDLPENTPEDPFLAFAGNINYWDPGLEGFNFEHDPSTGNWMLRVHRTESVSNLEFLVTRGSIERSEGDAFGQEIRPRTAVFGVDDTVYVQVLSWVDLERESGSHITLIVDVPAHTPESDPIYFVGEINDWWPYQQRLRLEKKREGQYFIILPERALNTEYKFTRGGWRTVECDASGKDIPNRVLKQDKSETIHVTVEGWIDLRPEGS